MESVTFLILKMELEIIQKSNGPPQFDLPMGLVEFQPHSCQLFAQLRLKLYGSDSLKLRRWM